MAVNKTLSSKEAVEEKLNTLSPSKMQFSQVSNSRVASAQKLSSATSISKVASIMKQTEHAGSGNSKAFLNSKSSQPYPDSDVQNHCVDSVSADSNVNKQQMCLKERINTIFLHAPETPSLYQRGHSTFHETPKIVENECLSVDSQSNDSSSTSPFSKNGFPMDVVKMPALQSEMKQEEDNEKEISPSIEQHLSKEVLANEDSPSRNVELYIPEDKYAAEEEPPCSEHLKPCSPGPTDTCSDSAMGYQQPSVTECDVDEYSLLTNPAMTNRTLHTDRTITVCQPHSEYPVLLQPVPSQNIAIGPVSAHQAYPGAVGDYQRGGPVLRACLKPTPEAVYGLEYDDSVFPTKHRLSTSEEMRDAMMQARKTTFYRRPNAVPMESSQSVGDNRRSPYSRFSHSSGGDCLLKYRHMISALNRKSFSEWKSEMAIRAGQKPDPNEEISRKTNPFLDKVEYLRCLRCYQPMTGIYGKPCLCRTIAPNRCSSNNKKPRKNSNSRNRNSQTANNIWSGCSKISTHLPSSAGNDSCNQARPIEECESARNTVKTGMLGDRVLESTNPSAKSSSAIKVSHTSTSREPDKALSHTGNGEGTACSSVTFKSTSSKRQTKTVVRDLTILQPPDKKSQPLREWEINKLEVALKNCLSGKPGISRS